MFDFLSIVVMLPNKLIFIHKEMLELYFKYYLCGAIFSAAFGGLIGLCTGFSFLSLAEIFYFFSLRCLLPICRKRKKGHQAGKQVNATDSTTELVVVQIDE